MRRGLGDTMGAPRGVTLMELMIALFLGAILMVGVLQIWRTSQDAYLDGAEAADVQQNVRIAMEQMARAIQMAGANPTNAQYGGATRNDPAFVAFREAGTNCLRIYADLDGNGNVQGAGENVSFSWTGTPGDPLLYQEGASAGQSDAGQVWVLAGAGAQELALNIAANPAPANPAMFQFFTGPNDATPNTALPAGGTCGMTDPNRSRIGRVIITVTARGTVGTRTFTRTLVSESRPRNVP